MNVAAHMRLEPKIKSFDFPIMHSHNIDGM